MSINNIQDTLIAEFDKLSEKVNKFKYFRYLLQVAKSSDPIGIREKKSENLITGCNKKIWLLAWYENGKVFFKADSENQINKGMLTLLLKVFSGHSPKEIINADLYLLHEINLYDYLSGAWTNDLLSILQKIKTLAISFHLKNINERVNA